MSKVIPAVQKYMTTVPKTIGSDRPLDQAINVMRDLNIRHLPVLQAGRLVGILTDRDVKLVLGFENADATKIKVEEAYTPNPYFTSPEAPLNEVVSEMASHKYGCALIVDNNKLVGIFTEIDAYKALGELLETRLKH